MKHHQILRRWLSALLSLLLCLTLLPTAALAAEGEDSTTEYYKNGEQQEGFVFETNCLKNTTFVSELDNSPEQVEAPIIIPDRMNQGTTFIGTQEIYLFCNTDGAAIHYTLDGTTPTKDSTQYSGPFTIDRNCVVKVIAVKEGMADSDVVTSGKFIKVTGIDEPSIRFSSDGKAYPANGKIPFDNFSKEYEYVLVPNDGAANDYANVNVRGKVAVVRRGNITFADKYNNAKANGAAGLIIYNNQSGKLRAGLGDMSEAEKTIPFISTTQEAGLAALHNTKDNIYGTLRIDPQQPGFKIKVCNVRYLTGERHLLTGRVRFTALCGEGDFVTMDQNIAVYYDGTGFLPSDYWDNFAHWSCNDPNVSLTEKPGDVDSPKAYDRLITFPDHDIQLIANWKDETLPEPHYEITFHLNDEGTPDPAATAVTGTDGKLTALLHDPVRSGYLFEGWYTAAEGGEEVTVDRVYDAPTTLYVHWAADDGSIAINNRNFPDGAFRTFVADYDTDENGRLSAAELEAVARMECRDLGIADLTGIAYFTALEELNCTANRLTELDVSRNTALKKLYCGKNRLTSLNVNGNAALKDLLCFKNRLTALDVSKNTALTYLDCSNNQLTSLDISKNTQLHTLYADNNAYEIEPDESVKFNLSTLPGGFNRSKAGGWTGGSVSGNTLTVDKDAALVTYTYDVGKAIDGKSTVAFTLMIKDADTGIAMDAAHFPDAAFRAYLSDPDSNIDRNQDDVLSAGEIALVREIDVYDESDIKSLEGIEYFTALTYLNCHGCALTSLDLSKNAKLTDLSADENTYEIQPYADGTFALSTLPGKFDESKASEWNGGTVKDGILTVNKDAEEVTYDYDCGNNQKVNFTLKIAKKYTVTAYDLYGSRPGFTPGKTYTGSYAASQEVRLPIGEREGYTFRGLTCEGIEEKDLTKTSDMGQPIVSFTMPANDVTITVNWVKNGSSSSGSSGSSSGSSTYPVTVTGKIENGSVTVSPKNASKGTTVTVTVTPDKGYTLETLTVTDKNGSKLALKDKGSGKYTFTQPSGKVTVTATFMDDNTMLNYFVDIQASDYCYDAVLWAAKKGITSGTDAAHFSPNQPCTRAQIVTFLWRTAGSPVVNYAMNMSDVPEDAYYAEAVRWALSEGITGGVGDGRFDPNATCTREQAVAFLYRAADSPAVSGGSAFSDVAVNAYYADAVAWAEQNEVTGGIGGGLFGSGRNCTRAQIVTFLYRAYQGK